MAGKDHIKASFDKAYQLENFSKNILLEIFGANRADIFKSEFQKDESNNLAASEKKVIQKVLHYGNLTLDDTATLKLYEITLQSNVRIEQSKVGIQQYIRKNLLSGEGALVNFINPDDKNTWRLTLVASDAVLTDKGITNKKLNAKRYTFIVGASEQNKTISDRFAELEKASRIVLYPSENEKNAVRLVNTFSVEKLSTAFFDEYTLHYKKFVEYLENSNFRKSVFSIDYPEKATQKEKDNANKPIRDFAKKMLGRIVFLYFVQKKGWLGAANTDYIDGSDNFIFQLFEKSGANENFYHWLSKLFFETLNEQRNNEDFIMPDNTSVKIPYLNGGLFDPEDYDNKLLTFPAILFHSDDFEDKPLTKNLFNTSAHRGFLDFLNSFNFTVHEDSPEDHTVAVDPEMLGHIFENLLEDNKDKGAFYTPKEIVHYMCQESLIEYLKTHFVKVQNFDKVEKEINDLVKNKEIKNLSTDQLQLIDNLLNTVKICDPAIGSGAFPMGLLQEIFAIKELLAFATNSNWEPAKVKENIIQNSIYGVDIEKGAVDIARLRFWLSLIVNEEKPKALPNLDYKIVVGDSLLSKFGEQVIDIDWDIKGNSDFQKKIKKSIEELVDAKKDFFELKKEKVNAKKDIRTKTIDLLINILTFDKEKYFKEHSKTKSLFDQTTKEKQQQLAFDNHIYGFDKAIKELKLLKTNNEKFDFFDWKIDFAEILNENISNDVGFDIVIGNPPWVSMKGKHGIEESKRNNFDKLTVKYNGNTSMPNLFEYFIKAALSLQKKNSGFLCFIIPDRLGFNVAFSDLRNYILNQSKLIEIVYKWKFETVIADTMTIILKNEVLNDYNFSIRTRPENEKIDILKSEVLENNLSEYRGYDTIIIKKLVDKIKDNSEPLVNYCKTTSGFGGKSELITDERISAKQVEVVKGKSIEKYNIKKKYFFDFNDKNLTGRTKDKEKLSKTTKILLRKTGNYLIATLDDSGVYPEQSLYFLYDFDIDPKFILSLINSKLFTWYYLNRLVTNEDSTPQLKNYDLDSFPIKVFSSGYLGYFEKITDFILYSKQIEQISKIEKLIPTYFEQIVDGMVYELYFPELLKQHNRTIMEHLGELPALTDNMSDNQKMEIINTFFNRLNEKNHPVKINLEKMKEIEEIKIIEGIKE